MYASVAGKGASQHLLLSQSQQIPLVIRDATTNVQRQNAHGPGWEKKKKQQPSDCPASKEKLGMFKKVRILGLLWWSSD